MRAIPVFMLLWAATFAAPVHAQVTSQTSSECRLIMDVMSARWSIENHDPYSGEVPFKQFQLALTNSGNGTCTGTLEAELLGEPYGLAGPGTERVPYTLVDEEGGRDLTPRTGKSSRMVSGRPLVVGPGETVTRSLSLMVDASKLRGDGSFSQQLRLQGVGQELDVLTSRDLSLELQVRPVTAIQLAGAVSRRAGSGATIDLGELSEGLHQSPVQLQVQSTRGYVVSFSSENHGRLSLGTTGWSVPYALMLDGERYQLTQPSSMRVGGGTERFDHFSLGFDVDSVSGLRAGRYSDVLTISVQPM